jgi:hypothetical protein
MPPKFTGLVLLSPASFVKFSLFVHKSCGEAPPAVHKKEPRAFTRPGLSRHLSIFRGQNYFINSIRFV